MAEEQARAQDPYIEPILRTFKAVTDRPVRISCLPVNELVDRLKSPFTAGQRLWRNMFGWDEIGRTIDLVDAYSADRTQIFGYTYYTLLSDIWRHMCDLPAHRQEQMVSALKAMILACEGDTQVTRIVRLAKVMAALLGLPVVYSPVALAAGQTIGKAVEDARARRAAAAIGNPTAVVTPAMAVSHTSQVPQAAAVDEDPC
jgi:hypothetical protein